MLLFPELTLWWSFLLADGAHHKEPHSPTHPIVLKRFVQDLLAILALAQLDWVIHYNEVMLSAMRLKSLASHPFSQPFVQAQIKENIRALRHWPLRGEFTGDRKIHRGLIMRKMFPFDDVTMSDVLRPKQDGTLQSRHNGHLGVSTHQPHHCLLNRLFWRRSKKNIKAPRHWPLWGEFTGDLWIPHRKGQ